MALLDECAITPDVFDAAAYRDNELGDIHLKNLKEVLLSECIVRNLHNGAWLDTFKNADRIWHQRGKELLKKLSSQGRLRYFLALGDVLPSSDKDWAMEALASHVQCNLAAVITSPALQEIDDEYHLLSVVGKLDRSHWWQNRSPSIRLARNITAYLEHLGLILQCANSLMFIDPHLDTTLDRYADFYRLLELAAKQSSPPEIELHRVCYQGSGSGREFPDFQSRFRSSLAPHLKRLRLKVKIFIWDDFHDRYLISNLLGLLIPNGFDTSTRSNDRTTWNRLGRKQLDDVQLEFDPASRLHSLKCCFELP